MRKRLLIVIIVGLFLLGQPISLQMEGRSTDVTRLSTVEVNELLHKLADGWRDSSFVYPVQSFDYAVLDNNEKLLYKTLDVKGAESVNEATAERDTVRDITIDDHVVGKLIIYNHFQLMETNIENELFVHYLIYAGEVILLLLITVFWFEFRVIRPFDELKDFATAVSAGDLDKPLKMHKKNMFGAFTQSFDIMREKLAEAREKEYQANVSKKELVAQLSHDIKTPVASIKAMSEVLGAKEDRPQVKEKLDAIGAKADQIDGLVSNLFVSTLEELEKLDVSASDTESSFLEKIFRDADYNRHIRKLDIPECIILCDTLRIEQVINNIIFNSYKYANTDIFVEGITEGDSLKVSITDRGGGVPVEELNLITQQYKRGSNSEGKQGAGLGLFISRELMENMQGSLEVANADGGLKVSLSFKLA